MSRLPDIIFVVVLTATASILMAKPADQEITLTPAEPIQSVNFHPALFPGETVNFTVNIHDGEVNGKIYVFDGNPGIKLNNQQSLWTHQGNKDIKNKLEFEALNVGHENETISVEVSALWKSNSSGGGGGGDGSSSPDEITGLATGTASTQRHLFLWQYQQRIQFADDASTIGFKVSATCDGALANLADYHVVGAMGWTITQQGNDKITGMVRSKSASKDQLEIHYNQILQGTSPDEIAFANFDLAIAKYGKAGNLPEDRLPHHQVAQPPHEMNPGAIVIAPFASAEEGEENLTSNTRTRLTLKGNQPAIPGGTYTLSAANNLTKLKIYAAEQGGEPIKLPKTFSTSDLTQSLTFHIGAESFGAEDMPQTGKLTLTYQLPLLADNAKHELKDEVMVNLLPVDLISDLNNDGQITATDNLLRDAALASGATDEIKDKGTEYILQDDVMSNGAWDNQDQNGNICFDWPQYGNLDRAPASGEMDDDAIAIEVKAPSFGVAWFTHEAIGSLSFFREKECLNAIAINLEQPFDLSTQIPERLWIKFRPTVSTVATVKGKLTFHIGKSPSEEWGKIDLPLTLVPDFGCEKFFEAARNYIFERNTQVFLWDYKMPDRFNPSQIFRLCVMREEATTAKGYDAYANNKKGIGAVALAAGFNPPTVMVNGNQCFFQAGYEEGVNLDLIWMVNQIADRCHGRVIIGGATAGISSDNFDNSTQPAPGSDLAGPDPVGNFAGIDGIYGTADDIPNPRAANPGGKFFSLSGSTWNFAARQATGTDAVGGLSSNYASSIRSDKAHQMFGRVPCGEQGKGCVFTATQIYGVGQAPAFAAAAKRSGNKMLSPSVDVLAQELLILDSGGGSLALQHIDPVGNLRKGYIGRKSATGFPYYVNNYVQFWATKPRP